MGKLMPRFLMKSRTDSKSTLQNCQKKLICHLTLKAARSGITVSPLIFDREQLDSRSNKLLLCALDSCGFLHIPLFWTKYSSLNKKITIKQMLIVGSKH